MKNVYLKFRFIIHNILYIREDLIIELQEMKRKYRTLNENSANLKAENHRLEVEAAKQQKRIDQLLNLSEGAKHIGLSSEIRREIEKSILVRQLKNQINILINLKSKLKNFFLLLLDHNHHRR